MVKRCNGLGMSSKFFDAIPVHAADPAGANPCIPARELHILHCPRTIDFMPVVGRSVTTATAQLACSMNRPLVHRAPSCFNMFLSWITMKCQGCNYARWG